MVSRIRVRNSSAILGPKMPASLYANAALTESVMIAALRSGVFGLVCVHVLSFILLPSWLVRFDDLNLSEQFEHCNKFFSR